MARNILHVIAQIRALVPADYQDGRMIKSLDSLDRSVAYAAPEQERDMWVRLYEDFEYHIGTPPIEDWQFEAAAILMDTTVEKVRARVKLITGEK